MLYLLWHSKLRVKKCTPLWFRNVLLVSSLLIGKAWQACAQQTEKNHSHTNSAVSRQVYVHALLVQHLWSVFFQYMIWYGPTSETVWMQRRQKNWLKYIDCAERKKITIGIYWNRSKSFKSCCCSFFFDWKKMQITVQVSSLFHFFLLVDFSNEK